MGQNFDRGSVLDKADLALSFDHKPGWKGNKDRIFRKLVEEVGEYAEALEYADGARGKIKKYAPVPPAEKCKEEIVDTVMMGLALAQLEGLSVADVLNRIALKIASKTKPARKVPPNSTSV